MLKTFNTLMAIQTATYVNLLLYCLRLVPPLRRIVRESAFARVRLKKAIAAVVRIAVPVGQAALSLAYVGFVLPLPVTSFGERLLPEEQLAQFVHALFLLSFVVAGVTSAAMLEPRRGKFIAVRLLRMSPAEYMRVTLTHKYVWYFLRMALALALFGRLLGLEVWRAALLAAAAAMARVLWEYVHLKAFERAGFVIVRKTGLVWAVILAGYACAYAPLVWPAAPSLAPLILHPVFLVAVIAAGAAAAYRLARYGNYRAVVEAATRRDDPMIDLGRAMSEANRRSLRMGEADYALDEEKAERAAKVRTSTGYAYLTDLFFERHRRLVRRPVHIRLWVIAGVGLAGLAAGRLFAPEAGRYLALLMETKLPVLFLAMLYLSTGEQMCRAFFYHCDVNLLRHRFYRNDAFAHFFIRLVRLIGQNALVAAALAAALTVVYLEAGGGTWGPEIVFLWISALALSVFFSVHHLALYYLLQPYTTELNVRNPLFFLFHSVIGGICGLSLFIRVPSGAVAACAAALAIVYLLAALVLVRRYGSRTFRVK